MAKVLTADQWLDIARNMPNRVVEYYRGQLTRQNATAAVARDLYNRGLVDLVQKRLGPNDYRYLMIARHNLREPVFDFWDFGIC